MKLYMITIEKDSKKEVFLKASSRNRAYVIQSIWNDVRKKALSHEEIMNTYVNAEEVDEVDGCKIIVENKYKAKW